MQLAVWLQPFCMCLAKTAINSTSNILMYTKIKRVFQQQYKKKNNAPNSSGNEVSDEKRFKSIKL